MKANLFPYMLEIGISSVQYTRQWHSCHTLSENDLNNTPVIDSIILLNQHNNAEQSDQRQYHDQKQSFIRQSRAMIISSIVCYSLQSIVLWLCRLLTQVILLIIYLSWEIAVYSTPQCSKYCLFYTCIYCIDFIAHFP